MASTNTSPFAAIPHALIEQLAGTDHALRIMLLLYRYCDWSTGMYQTCAGQLAEKMGVSADTANRALNYLHHRRYIGWKRPPRGSRSYYPIWINNYVPYTGANKGKILNHCAVPTPSSADDSSSSAPERVSSANQESSSARMRLSSAPMRNNQASTQASPHQTSSPTISRTKGQAQLPHAEPKKESDVRNSIQASADACSTIPPSSASTRMSTQCSEPSEVARARANVARARELQELAAAKRDHATFWKLEQVRKVAEDELDRALAAQNVSHRP